MSPTFAEEIPDPENMVAVVLVPVILFPEYHWALDPAAPVAPVKAIPKVNCLWITILPLSRETGISTVPPAVTDVSTEIVTVGDVVSVSTEVVTPEGAVMALLSTAAATWLAPHMAMTVVVVLPALAAEVEPAKVNESLVSITE
jgi:hypothetical protein